jgi:sulfur relay protein TusC/DsrF
MATKKFMFVNRKAPYGTIYALESLEVVLITATFDQDVSLAFLDDGVYELVKGQDTKAIGIKNHARPTARSTATTSRSCTSSASRWRRAV